jgi:NADPH:quinone reductase-like Zn-dependent oxidoreductase
VPRRRASRLRSAIRAGDHPALQSSFQHVPLALKDLFAWVADGSLKIDVTRYPLRDAAKAQDDFAARKTTGKVILKPFE